MSLLTPLYLLGLLAVSLPVVFHLIRRMPKADFSFSSLMFLSPSPPRLTRRSRLEHWLLLALRALALGLLAFAFARPFLRQDVAVDAGEGEGRRVAIVIDTSASMRRGDLWQRAVAEVDAVLAEVGPLDQVAIYNCDETLRPLLGFEQLAEVPRSQRRGLIRDRLAAVSPTWAGTYLGRGLTDAVEIVNNLPDVNEKAARWRRQIVLVTDLQAGSRLDALAEYPWPENVELELRALQPKNPTNAGLHHLVERSPVEIEQPGDLRVRVSNDAASAVDQFRLTWLGENEQPIGEPVEVYVPAGESRVVRVRRPVLTAAAERLQLSGDGCEFDNTLYVATLPKVKLSVAYIGNDAADDPQRLRYYLERALGTGSARPVELHTLSPGEPLPSERPTETPLVVVTEMPTAEQTRQLREFVDAGGTVLWVMTEGDPSGALAELLGTNPLDVEEADVDNYTMLGQIAFDHPLFASMAGPQFNDFTQIHFWKYRRLNSEQLGDATVVARFENGEPAVVERRLGKGQVDVIASSWQPSDSQLARSWKFVLFLSALVEGRRERAAGRIYFTVGEPVQLGDARELGVAHSIVKPDGERVTLAADAGKFDGTDEPGLYVLEVGNSVTASRELDIQGEGKSSSAEDVLREMFAVNLDPAESATSSLAVETLEQLGCRLVNPAAMANNAVRQQQLADMQLESRQKWWQWLLATVLGVLVIETWLAGRITKSGDGSEYIADPSWVGNRSN